MNRLVFRGSQRGFSLLEILVAFVLMAIAIGMLLSIFSAGLRNANVAEGYTNAVQIAESVMARVGPEIPLQPGQLSGVEDEKYRWDLIVDTFDLTTATIDTQVIPAQLYMATVTVSWASEAEGGRQFELAQLKMAGKANAEPTR